LEIALVSRLADHLCAGSSLLFIKEGQCRKKKEREKVRVQQLIAEEYKNGWNWNRSSIIFHHRSPTK